MDSKLLSGGGVLPETSALLHGGAEEGFGASSSTENFNTDVPSCTGSLNGESVSPTLPVFTTMAPARPDSADGPASQGGGASDKVVESVQKALLEVMMQPVADELVQKHEDKPVRGPLGSSKYKKGVTLHRRTGRWEAHIWESTSSDAPHKQIYLGGFDMEQHAAKAHDIMAIKCRGVTTELNFKLSVYEPLLECVEHVDRCDLVNLLRRQSRELVKLHGGTKRSARANSSHPGQLQSSSPQTMRRSTISGGPPVKPAPSGFKMRRGQVVAVGKILGSDPSANVLCPVSLGCLSVAAPSTLQPSHVSPASIPLGLSSQIPPTGFLHGEGGVPKETTPGWVSQEAQQHAAALHEIFKVVGPQPEVLQSEGIQEILKQAGLQPQVLQVATQLLLHRQSVGDLDEGSLGDTLPEVMQMALQQVFQGQQTGGMVNPPHTAVLRTPITTREGSGPWLHAGPAEDLQTMSSRRGSFQPDEVCALPLDVFSHNEKLEGCAKLLACLQGQQEVKKNLALKYLNKQAAVVQQEILEAAMHQQPHVYAQAVDRGHQLLKLAAMIQEDHPASPAIQEEVLRQAAMEQGPLVETSQRPEKQLKTELPESTAVPPAPAAVVAPFSTACGPPVPCVKDDPEMPQVPSLSAVEALEVREPLLMAEGTPLAVMPDSCGNMLVWVPVGVAADQLKDSTYILPKDWAEQNGYFQAVGSPVGAGRQPTSAAGPNLQRGPHSIIGVHPTLQVHARWKSNGILSDSVGLQAAPVAVMPGAPGPGVTLVRGKALSPLKIANQTWIASHLLGCSCGKSEEDKDSGREAGNAVRVPPSGAAVREVKVEARASCVHQKPQPCDEVAHIHDGCNESHNISGPHQEPILAAPQELMDPQHQFPGADPTPDDSGPLHSDEAGKGCSNRSVEVAHIGAQPTAGSQVEDMPHESEVECDPTTNHQQMTSTCPCPSGPSLLEVPLAATATCPSCGAAAVTVLPALPWHAKRPLPP